jgi:hypothetical protein
MKIRLKTNIRLDETLGAWAGIVVAVVVGKLWIVPWMGWWEVVKVVVGRLVG